MIVDSLVNEHDPLMTAPESINLSEERLYYIKTQYGLNVLRNLVLGADRFDFAFNTYIKRWAYKHPRPEDFFRSMNDASGENLNWFWKEWFYTTWLLDQAVTSVKYVNSDPAQGSLITIENKGKMALPVLIKVDEENGKTQSVKLPVEIWQRGGVWAFKINSTSKITSVVIDPDHVFLM